jgi:hypothetical protein
MSDSGLTRVGGVVVLNGPALRSALQATLIATRNRKLSGLPTQTYDALACELHAAMAAAGQSVIDQTELAQPDAMDEHPTVPLAEASARLNISDRQARRRAPQLGGKKIAGRWFVDEIALRQHIEGRQ